MIERLIKNLKCSNLIEKLKCFKLECSTCQNTGKILTDEFEFCGYQKYKKCDKCKYSKYKRIFIKLLNWIIKNPFKHSPFLIAAILTLIINISVLASYKNLEPGIIFNLLLASFGMLFIALKYKLDQAVYNKSLFEERYSVFIIIDKILTKDCFHPVNKEYDKKTKDKINEELESIYRKSYLLFGKETYKFILNFIQQVRNHISFEYDNAPTNQLKKQKELAKKSSDFLANLREDQRLSEKFPELKLDVY